MNKNEFPIDTQAVINAFKNNKTFFIAVHQNPDGDTLGAALCTADILKKMHKKVYVFSADKVPDNLKFMPFSEIVKQTITSVENKKFAVCVFFECSTLKRAGNVEKIVKNSKKIINIDHHKTHSKYGDTNCVDSHASSVSELVFKIFSKMGVSLTIPQAECLYIGIATDTGRFYYKSATKQAFMTTAKLIDIGVKIWKINEQIYGVKSLPALKLASKALESLKIINKRFSVMHLTREDFKFAKALPEHTEYLVNYGLMPENVEIALLIKQLPDCTAVNLRAKEHIDISKIAKKFGGGGHKNAAGFKTKRSLKEIEPKLIREIKNLLKQV